MEDIIDGVIKNSNTGEVLYNATNTVKNEKFNQIRSMYYSALARERYNMYKSNYALDD